MSEHLAFYLLPMLNAASIFGRVLPNLIADKTGPLNMLLPTSLTTGILALCWIAIKNTAGLIVLATFYGFCSGGFVSLPPVAIISLTPDLRTVGTRMGMCFGICSLGLLVGTPVGGAILTRTGSYVGLQLFSGATIFATGLLLVATRVVKAGWKIRVKV